MLTSKASLGCPTIDNVPCVSSRTSFIFVVFGGCFHLLAEVYGDYLAKGRPVFVEGRLQMDSWETEDGQKKSKLKVVAQNIQFLGGKADSETASPEGEDDIPF